MHHKLLTVILCLAATFTTTWAQQTPPPNEIWYTTTDGKMAEIGDDSGFYEENGMDFKVISHTYSNGKGVVRANSPIRAYGFFRIDRTCNGLYFSSNTLETITFPECTETLYLYTDCRGFFDFKLKNNKGLKEINCRYSSSDGRCVVIDGDLIDFAPGGLTEYVIPDGITSIGCGDLESDVFEDCTDLINITIPDSVTDINVSAFSGCNLQNVTVGNLYCFNYFADRGVPNINFCGPNATSDGRCLIINSKLERFNAKGLTSYDFPESVTEISEEALNECKKLQSATVADSQCYDIFKQAGISVLAFSGSNASADGRGLIRNGKLERFMATGLTSYDFPEDVTEISTQALNECENLKSVTVANYQCYDVFKRAGISVSAFTGSNASTDGRYLISKGHLERFIATGLTSYDFPENITFIRTPALNECKSLKSVTVANSQCYDTFKHAGIYVSAFTGSNASTDGRCLVVNDKLTVFIGDGAKEYVIPQNVTKISNSVFNNCSDLTNITIPSNVTAIGDQQFSGCNTLVSITCLAMTPPVISDLGIAETTLIYVPKDAVKGYKNDLKWERYKKQIKPLK